MEKILKKGKSLSNSSVVKSVKMEKILKKNNVRICEESFKYHQSMTMQEELSPVINFRKKGDEIEAIEIICICGNKIEILCQYE